MRYPMILQVFSPTKDGLGDPFTQVPVFSTTEYESIKSLHSAKGHIIKEQQLSLYSEKTIAYRIIKFLLRHGEPLRVAEVKRLYWGLNHDITAILKNLHDWNLVRITQDNFIERTEYTRPYIDHWEREPIRLINVNIHNYDFALIQFLYTMGIPIHLDDFPDILVTAAPQHGNAINQGNLIHSLFRLKQYIKEVFHNYSLTATGESYYVRTAPEYPETKVLTNPQAYTMNRKQISDEILQLADDAAGNNVDIAPLIAKYAYGADLEEEMDKRMVIKSILIELKKHDEIDFDHAGFTASRAGAFIEDGCLIRSTYSRQKTSSAGQTVGSSHTTNNIHSKQVVFSSGANAKIDSIYREQENDPEVKEMARKSLTVNQWMLILAIIAIISSFLFWYFKAPKVLYLIF